MLVYLASFPRSGNSMLRSILYKNFHLDASDAGKRISRGLSEEERREQAGAQQLFFVKTHHQPPAEFLPGEKVIRITRHPGASIWSYFRLLSDEQSSIGPSKVFGGFPPTLENVILGHTRWGDWSDYSRAWLGASEALAEPALGLRYEEMVADQSDALEKISAFLAAPVTCREPVSFAAYQNKPSKQGQDLRGTSAEYERFYTSEQLSLMWQRHGPLATQLRFTPPDHSLVSPGEQIHRLRRIIDNQFKRGRQMELAKLELQERVVRLKAKKQRSEADPQTQEMLARIAERKALLETPG